jgi:hypothetical protein
MLNFVQNTINVVTYLLDDYNKFLTSVKRTQSEYFSESIIFT